MARRSAPPSSRWVANEWRSACGDTPPATRRAAPGPQPPAHVGGRQPPAGLRQEQRRLVAPRRRGGGEHRTGPLGVVGHRPQRDLPDGHDPRLGPLALLLVEVDGADVQRDELLGPQARGVGDLEWPGRGPPGVWRPRCGPAGRPPRRGAARAAARPGAWGRASARPGCGRRGRARAASGRRRAGRRACGRPSSPRCGGPTAARRSGAASWA